MIDANVTVEFALLLALFGGAFVWLARAHHDHGAVGGGWTNAPPWLKRMARRGDGPLRANNLALEAYGLGVIILGLGAAAFGGESRVVNGVFAAWVLGGIVVAAILDVMLSLRARLRGRSAP
jgi:hypothetical protein